MTSPLISGSILQAAARREIIAFTKNPKLRQVVLYNTTCRITNTQYLGNALSHLNYSSPSGSRFLGKKYKIAIITDDTVARFELMQNNYDTTLYQLFYLKYTITSANDIGLIKIDSSLTRKCQ